jgi:uncharacterized protein YgiM (DUF1202 family)
MRAPHAARAILAWVLLTVSTVTLTLVSAPQAQAASGKTYTVTTTVNVRSSKSTKATVVGTIAAGSHIRPSGTAKSGWMPIKYNAKTAYISTKYLKRDAKTSSIVVSGPVGTKKSTMSVPIRVKAKVTATALKVAPKGTVMDVTGATSGIYTQVVVDGTTAWASTRRLTSKTTVAPTPVVLPATVATYTTTASLALRKTASVTATNQVTIATGSTVAGTGQHSGSYSQVVFSGKVGWVITGYLKAVDGTDAQYVLPLRATNVSVVAPASLYTSADASSAVVGQVAVGITLRSTAEVSGTFVSVIWNGGIAWAQASTVTMTLGSSSLDKLEVNGKAAVIEIRPLFPKITSIYGWRASSSYSSDHPNGRAVDFMIPSYKTNKALGDALAAYVIANGKRLHVTYLIWQQRSYTISTGKWKAMEDRGSDTQNHKDHVHVSFEPSSK